MNDIAIAYDLKKLTVGSGRTKLPGSKPFLSRNLAKTRTKPVASRTKKRASVNHCFYVVATRPSLEEEMEEEEKEAVSSRNKEEDEDEEEKPVKDYQYLEPIKLDDRYKELLGNRPDAHMYTNLEEEAHMYCRICRNLYPVFCEEQDEHRDKVENYFFCRGCGKFADHKYADCPVEPKKIRPICRVCGLLYPCIDQQTHGNISGDGANWCRRCRCYHWGHVVQECSIPPYPAGLII